MVLRNDPLPRRPLPAPPTEPRPAPTGSVAIEWVSDRLARGAPRAYNALARLHLWRPLGRDTVVLGDLRVYKRRCPRQVEEAWTLTGEILDALAREAEAQGSRFASCRADRDWELTRMRHGMEESAWDRTLVSGRVTEMGRRAGFPVPDLTPVLPEVTGRFTGEPYLLYLGHWNARGHRVAAGAVAAWLRTQGWLSACVASR